MKNAKIKTLVEGAVMLAFATVLSYARVITLPWGGSVTALSMLPIIIFGIRHGVKDGFFLSFCFALIQLGQGIIDGLFGWGLTIVTLISCILIDYIAAYTVLGTASLFRKKGPAGWICGTVVAIFLRFLCHLASGVFIWKSVGELWNGFVTENVWIYSLIYNGAYMLPELIFTTLGAFILFTAPVTKRFITKK